MTTKNDLPEEEVDQTDDDIARITWQRFGRAAGPHDTWCDEAKTFENMFAGDQWQQEDLDKLKETGRPALTINLSKPAILAIVGEQQKTRVDITFKPRNAKADQDTATLLAQVAQYVDSDVGYSSIESQAFFDACVTDRGYIDTRISFDNNINGDIAMAADNPKLVVLDPDCKTYNPDEWPGVFETYWSSIDRIETLYGKEKATSLLLGAGMDIDYAIESMSIRWSDDRIARNDSTATTPFAVIVNGEERYIESVRIVEHQYFVYKKAWVLIDRVTGDIIDPRCDLDGKAVKKIAKERGLVAAQMPRRRVRWVVCARNVVLYKGWSPYPFLTKVPVFTTFMRGRPLGMMRDLVSPQEQLNKIESQELHVINTTANSGWMYEDGSILNMEDEELEQKGAETGLVLKYRKGANPPEKIQPNQIPSGLSHKASKNVEYIRFISMVNDAMLGFSSPEVSGVALNAKKESGITAFVPAFTNLMLTRNIIAKRVLWFIQNFYTETRLIRITDYTKPERPTVDIPLNVRDETGNVLNNITVGRYDVVATTAPARDTHEDGQFAQMMEMRGIGVTIPDDEIIRRSNLTEKFPLAERVAQMQGMGEPSPEETQIQVMLQQMQVMEMKLGLSKLEAEISNLQAQAQLNFAKAETLRAEAQAAGGEGAGGDALIKAAVERERMATDLQKTQMQLQARLLEVQATLDTKKEIAGMQVGAKQDAMVHKSAIERAKAANQEAQIQRQERNEQANLAFKAALQAKQIEHANKKQPRQKGTA